MTKSLERMGSGVRYVASPDAGCARNPDPLDPALRGAALFQGVDDAAVSALTGQMTTSAAERGSVIFRQGEPGRCLYFILSGKVKLAREDADGREQLVALLGPGDQFGELSLLDPGPRTASATVVTDVRLAQLDKAELERWILEHPDIAMRMLRVLSRRLRRTRAEVTDLVFVDVPGRVAKRLLEFARRFGVTDGSGLRVAHDLTQSELAQLIGASRETVNKALSDFATRGWIRLEKGSVLILDRERLVRRAR